MVKIDTIDRTGRLMELQVRLGHTWEDLSLLDTALRHPSYANRRGLEHNQVLEFLGDSVIDLLVGEYLITFNPDQREGFLSMRRAELVMKSALAARAQAVGLGEYLLAETGRNQTRLQENPGALADALEAVVAAAYRDGGLSAARMVLMRTGVLP